MCVYVLSSDTHDFCTYEFYKWDTRHFPANFHERNAKYTYSKDIWFTVIYCHLHVHVGGIVVRPIPGCEAHQNLSMLAWYLVNVHLFLVTPLKAIGTSLGLFFQVEKVFSRLGVKGRAVSRLDGKVRAMFRLRWMMWAMFQLRWMMYVEWWNASCHTSTCIWHMYWRNFNSSWISIPYPTEQYTWYIFDIS